MSSAFNSIDSVSKRKQRFSISIVILQGYVGVYVVLFSCEKNWLITQDIPVSIQVPYKIDDSAFVAEFLLLFIPALRMICE